VVTLRRWLIIGGGAVIAAAGIGGTIVLRSYDDATKIDRSVPTVVVRQYIDAFMTRKDNGRAALFTCSSSPQLGAMNSLREHLTRQDAVHGTSTQVVVSWINTTDGGRSVEAELELNEATGVEVRTQIELWRFGLVDQNGWRVCSAERLPDPSPTPSASTQPTAG